MATPATQIEILARYGVEWPSVTEVLKLAGLIDDQWFTEHSAWRGSVVHKCCEYEDFEDLDEGSVDERIAGYLEAWRKFKRETGYQPVSTEKIVRDDNLRIIGRLDGVGEMAGEVMAVVDRKTGAVSKATALQTAAYTACLEKPLMYRRFAVALKSDGKYSMIEFPRADYRRDLQRWTAARIVAELRKEWKVCRQS